MKFDQLRYFLETARQGHVGKAADVLAISPSAISHSIAELERELGRDLFLKQGKNIVLTSHGRLLMDRVRGLLNQVEAVRDEIASDNVELQGHYRMAATHLLCSKFLAPAWAELQKTSQRLTAEIYSLRSADVVAGIVSGSFDFGLCLNPQPHPAVNAEKVYGGQMVVAVRRNHPLLKLDKARAVRALSGYPASLPKAFQGVDNCESHPVFDRLGISPDIRFVFDSYDVAVEHLVNSQAWALLPCWIVRSNREKIAWIIPREWDAPVFASALWPKNRLPTRALKRLVSSLGQRFKELPV